MNAGAYGGEFSQVVKEAAVLNDAGETILMDRSDLEFGYRSSSIQRYGYTVLR